MNKYQEALNFLQEECRSIKKDEAQKHVETLQELVDLFNKNIRIVLVAGCDGITNVYSNYPKINIDLLDYDTEWSANDDEKEFFKEIEDEIKSLKRITSI